MARVWWEFWSRLGSGQRRGLFVLLAVVAVGAIFLRAVPLPAATGPAPTPAPVSTPAGDGYLVRPYDELSSTGVPGEAFDWVGSVAKLLLVLGLAYLTLALLRRYTQTAGGRASPRQRLRLVESIGLGQNRHVHLVRVGERLLVVGATAGQINTLAEIAEPDEVARLLDATEEPEAPRPFGDHMQSALVKLSGDPGLALRRVADRLSGSRQQLHDRIAGFNREP